MLSIVAARYANALVDVIAPHHATDPGTVQNGANVLNGLRAVQALIADSPTLRHALASPAVSPSRKRAVMRRLMEPMGLDEKVRNFVFVVVDHRRAGEYPSIVDAFENIFDERMGMVPATVESARELTDEQRSNIEAQVTRLAGRRAKVKFKIDPSVLAGVVVRVGSKVYDGSVRGQLERLRTKLVSN